MEISPRHDAEIYFPWHSVVTQLSDCCLQAGIRSKNSGISGGNADSAVKEFVNGAFQSKIQPDSPEGAALQESGETAEGQGVATPFSAPAPAVVDAAEPQTTGTPASLETLQEERDRIIRERDEALAEVERLKVALRHTSEALEAVCKTSLKEPEAV